MSNKSGLAAVDEAAESVSKTEHEKAVAAAREEGLKAGYADGLVKGQGEGRTAAEAVAAGQITAARTEGATAERERILGIETLGLQGHDKLIADFKADGKTTPEQAAMKIIQAEKAKGGAVLAALKADGATGAANVPTAEPPAPKSTGSTAILADTTVPLEDRCKAAFDADADLRAEFGKVETLVAYQRATEAGQAKIFRK